MYNAPNFVTLKSNQLLQLNVAGIQGDLTNIKLTLMYKSFELYFMSVNQSFLAIS